jgi:hypothetical protein
LIEVFDITIEDNLEKQQSGSGFYKSFTIICIGNGRNNRLMAGSIRFCGKCFKPQNVEQGMSNIEVWNRFALFVL